jgi:hypothetical protein
MATNRIQFLRKNNMDINESYSIGELARVVGLPVAALQAVYDRGEGAYSNNLGSVRLVDFSKNPDTKRFGANKRLSMGQWAMARVYSFLNKGKTYRTADADIAKKYNY